MRFLSLSLAVSRRLLLPLTALEGNRRQEYYRTYGVEILLLNRRLNFETPSGNGSGSWFATAWFTWGLGLPHQLTFGNLQTDSTTAKKKRRLTARRKK